MNYLVLAFLWPLLCHVSAFDVKTRQHCCSLGTNYSTNVLGCRAIQPPINGVSKTDERACLTTMDFCCKKEFRIAQCNFGKEDAKSGSCPEQDGDRRDCCQACRLGFDTKKAGDPCVDILGLVSPYLESFINCCEQTELDSTSTTTVKPSPRTEVTRSAEDAKNSKTTNESYPGLSEENVCETGEFCAQLCEPSGKSFICSCFSGYALMKDGVSCKPIKRAKGSRCEENNPCDHDCLDTGTSVECSCRKGYKLAADKTSCKDIDECALGIHECEPTEECENDEGTYFCFVTELDNDELGYNQCPQGHKFNPDKSVCDDIDECEIPLICRPPKICKNSIGSYVCEGPDCPPGFFYKASIEGCADIDECVTGDNDCNKNSQVCVNTRGNYTCVDKASRKACPAGFKKNPETLLCEDINECDGSLKVCLKDQQCVNEEGGYKCIPLSSSFNQAINHNGIIEPSITPKPPLIPSCPSGLKYNATQNTCDDINECQLRLDNCSPMHRCDNTVGSFYCTRTVSCGTGYTLNSANDLCEDDDECLLGTHNCYGLGPNYACKNQMGSFRCEAIRIPTFPILNPPVQVNVNSKPKDIVESTTLKAIPTTVQSNSFNRSPASLKPTSVTEGPDRSYAENPRPWWLYPPSINRPVPSYTPAIPTARSTTTALSPISQTPLNPYETFRVHYGTTTSVPIINGMLKKCLPGYRMNSYGDCEDIDECQSNPCPRGTKCLNFNGRFQCSSPLHCKIGFEMNEEGNECIDVDECAKGTHNCSKSQTCKNGQGYYTCECPAGHHLNRQTQVCEDLDECKFYRPCGNYAECTNTVGSYQCTCKPGLKMNQNYCEDINECEETPGLCDGSCINIWGSYRCACKAGFILNSDNRTCTDIDECQKFKDRKLCIGTCVNVPGSYTCDCPSGYKLGTDKRGCIDIDECQHNVCSPQDACVNTRGGYKCFPIICSGNYVKDPNRKARCKRLTCDPRDNQCLLMPEEYSYQYMALTSNLPLSEGGVTLYKIKGPNWSAARAEFVLNLLNVNCPPGVKCVDESYIRKILHTNNLMELVLVKSIQGPQEVKLEVEMKLFQGQNNLIGSIVVYIVIIVSEYSF